MSLLETAQNTNFHSNVDGNEYNKAKNKTVDVEKTLAKLKPVMRSGHGIPKCMENTRESIFRTIDLWLEGMSHRSRRVRPVDVTRALFRQF